METVDMQEALNYANLVPPRRDVEKMQYYRAKGSNPKRLVHDIAGNLDKLLSRYYIAIVMGWQEFAKEVERAFFANELTPNLTQELLDSVAIQAANSTMVIEANEENSFINAIKSILNGEEIQDEEELDKKLDGVTVPEFKPTFTHVL